MHKSIQTPVLLCCNTVHSTSMYSMNTCYVHIVMNSASNKTDSMSYSAIILTRIRPALMLTKRSVYIDIQLRTSMTVTDLKHKTNNIWNVLDASGHRYNMYACSPNLRFNGEVGKSASS